MWLLDWCRRGRTWLRREQWAKELDDEMRLHLDLREKALRERGLSATDARRVARQRFGNPLAIRLDISEQSPITSLTTLWQDLRFGARRVVRDLATSAAVVTTLAAGIGANTAMFTFVDQVLLTPPPGRDPARLTWVDVSTATTGRSRGFSLAEYLSLRRLPIFEDAAAFASAPMALGGDSPARLHGMAVSANYFEVLGIRPALGRDFAANEGVVPGRDYVVVIGHALWQTHFGSVPDIVGRTIPLNGRTFTVVGVAAEGFSGLELEPVALWVPLAMFGALQPSAGGQLSDQRSEWLQVVGRLAAGTPQRQATAALASAVGTLDRNCGEGREARRAAAEPIVGRLDPRNRRDAVPAVWLLAAVPILVLVVACANVANLLLARGLSRRKELATRRSLGASRARLVRQLLTESVLLAAIACIAGLFVASGLIATTLQIAEVPVEIGRLLVPSAGVVLASVGLGACSVVLFGLVPAFAVTEPSALPSPHGAGLSVQSGPERLGLRNTFVIGQVAVSFVLVIAAALFLKSVSSALHSDPGFDRHNALVLSVDPDLQGYDSARRARLTDALLHNVRALPRVQDAAVTSAVPLTGRLSGAVLTPDDRDGEGSDRVDLQAFWASVSPGYFQTMRVAMVGGRDFTAHDDAAAAPVVIVNQTLASRLRPQGSAIGARVRLAGANEPWRQVIGVVRDGTYDEYGEAPTSFFFLPASQRSQGRLTLVARTVVRPDASLIDEVRAVVRRLDPDLPVFEVASLDHATRNAIDKQQGASTVLGLFGVVALSLSALGLYALVSQGVTRRRPEIAIRMAMGATPGSIVSMFARQGLALTAVGVGLGVPASLAASTLLGSFLFGVRPADPPTFGTTALIFAAVATAASVLPTVRAAFTDPLRGLRHE